MPKSDLIAEEIKWCEEHRNPQAEVYQDGFISGLKHALFLMNSSPTMRAADVCLCSADHRHNFQPYTMAKVWLCEYCGTRR